MYIPFQIASNGDDKILNFLYIIEDRSLLDIGSIVLLGLFPCNMHYITSDRLESHAPTPCPTPKTVYILLEGRVTVYYCNVPTEKAIFEDEQINTRICRSVSSMLLV